MGVIITLDFFKTKTCLEYSQSVPNGEQTVVDSPQRTALPQGSPSRQMADVAGTVSLRFIIDLFKKYNDDN